MKRCPHLFAAENETKTDIVAPLLTAKKQKRSFKRERSISARVENYCKVILHAIQKRYTQSPPDTLLSSHDNCSCGVLLLCARAWRIQPTSPFWKQPEKKRSALGTGSQTEECSSIFDLKFHRQIEKCTLHALDDNPVANHFHTTSSAHLPNSNTDALLFVPAVEYLYWQQRAIASERGRRSSSSIKAATTSLLRTREHTSGTKTSQAPVRKTGM